MKLILCLLLFVSQAYAVIPDEVKAAKHIVGYVCLKEIQNAECGMPFKVYDKDGNALPTKVPTPIWAKNIKADTPNEMIDYDGYGYKVTSIEKDRVAILEGNEIIWIPKDKVNKYYPLEDIPFCEFSDKDWAKNLYKADLVTHDKVNSTHPFAGIEVKEKKWDKGQLWFKVKVYEGDSLGESESLGLGSFWVPYSKGLTICPKGC